MKTWDTWIKVHNHGIEPATWKVRTGSGDTHIYFRCHKSKMPGNTHATLRRHRHSWPRRFRDASAVASLRAKGKITLGALALRRGNVSARKRPIGSWKSSERRPAPSTRATAQAVHHQPMPGAASNDGFDAFGFRVDGRDKTMADAVARRPAFPTTTPNRSWRSPPSEKSGSARVHPSHSLVQRPPALRQPAFDFWAPFCHSAPMEAHAFGFRLRANSTFLSAGNSLPVTRILNSHH